MRSEILGGEIGDAVADRGERCNDKIIQLHCGGVTCHNGGTESVDDTLDQNISDGNKALLQDARDGNDQNIFQKVPVEYRGLFLDLDFFQPVPDSEDRKNTADPLTQKGCPGHARHSHLKSFHKQDIHGDVGCGGYRQKIKRSFGIAQCGKDAGCDIVKEHKGQPPYINIQVQFRVRKDFRGRPDQMQQRTAPQNADEHQNTAQNGAENAGCGHGGFQPAVILCTEKL